LSEGWRGKTYNFGLRERGVGEEIPLKGLKEWIKKSNQRENVTVQDKFKE